jgi:hypothetical protein
MDVHRRVFLTAAHYLCNKGFETLSFPQRDRQPK